MIYEIIDTRTGERAKAYELVQEPWAEKTRGCDWPALAVDETGDVMLTDDCGNYDMVPEGRVEVRLVVDREKWKPCSLCGEYEVFQFNAWHASAMSLRVPDRMGTSFFCPHCGRPLTDVEWAELEKKIRGCVE